jgi:hypothetical protein
MPGVLKDGDALASCFLGKLPALIPLSGSDKLRILNAIFLTVVRCGGNGNVRGGEAFETSIQFCDSAVQFRLTTGPGEAKRFNRNASMSNCLPDRLRLSILDSHGIYRNRRTWEDSEEQTIETQIAEIVVDLITAAEMQYRESCLRRHVWIGEQKEAVKNRIDQEQQLDEIKANNQAIALAKKRLGDLSKMAENLQHAQDIRVLVKAMRTPSPRFDSHLAKDRFQNWCRWALAQADELDPVRKANGLFN